MQNENKTPAPSDEMQAADAAASNGTQEAGPHHAGGADDLGLALGADQLKQIIDALQTENDKLRAELDGAKEQALRVHAEMDNMRKRGERERADTAKYAITKFAGDVIGVADNFERALQSVPAEAVVDNPTLKALHEGVEMTEREFLKALERHGVKRIEALGGAFNPHQHQAVMEQDNADVPSGTVVQVFQPGYVIEDRVLRPAMVVVSKGGPKMAKPAEAANGAPPPPANDDAADNGQPG